MRHTAPAVNSPPRLSSQTPNYRWKETEERSSEEQLLRNKIKAARLDAMDACVWTRQEVYIGGSFQWQLLGQMRLALVYHLTRKAENTKKRRRNNRGWKLLYTHTHTDQTLFFFFLFLYVRLLFIWISLSLKFPSISNLSLFFSSSLYERDKTTKCFWFFFK